MRSVELTLTNGCDVLLNVDNIAFVRNTRHSMSRSLVRFRDGQEIVVLESYDEIKSLLDDEPCDCDPMAEEVVVELGIRVG